MLGYMNEEALRRTVESGLVTFWSRSRQSIWQKGETSGNLLRLVELRQDCDGDALLVLAEPIGPTCHTGEPSCFHRQLDGEMARDRIPASGEESIVGAAIVILVPAERLRAPPPTSGQYLPHLDWIFVAWMEQRRGIGTLLLGGVVSELRALGHTTLASTVLTGQAAPMLWHWSTGFRLPRGG